MNRDPMENEIPTRMMTLDEQRLLTAFIQTSHDAIIGKDRNGIITSWNPGAERVFGYTAKEVIGKPITILFPPDRLDEKRAIEQEVFVKGGYVKHYETVRRRKDGSLVDVSLTISPIRNEQGEIIGASKFAHDITDRKKAEMEVRELNRTLESRIVERSNALIQTEKRYHDALDKMMEGVQIIDRGWRYTYLNDAVIAQSRYTRDELLGHTMMEMYPGIEHTPLFGVLETCMTDQCARIMENEFVFPDGTKGVFQLSIQPMADGLFILSSDITDRKKAEEALRISEQRYYHALDSMMEGVSIIGFDWRYVFVNMTTASRSEHSRDELIGRSLMEVYPGIEKHPLFPVLERCMTERVAEKLDVEFKFPNGKVGQFAMSIQPAIDGLFLLSTDITERKRWEQELEAHREQLKRQNIELEQFAYIASHDLQEPLRMVSSYVQLLERRYKDKLDSDANEFIAFAVDGTVRMKQLINDLLSYSMLGRPVTIEAVDMQVVLEQVRANLTAAIAESGAVVTSTELPSLRACQSEMVQVMQNLIGNAMKFHQPHAVPQVDIKYRLDDEYHLFSVTDNGIGIEEEYKEKVFIPFKRLHDRWTYTGSGIGLAVVRKIIHRYGGNVWFTSQPGKGTTFFFTIKRSGG